MSEKLKLLIIAVLIAGGVYDYAANGDKRDRPKPVISTATPG